VRFWIGKYTFGIGLISFDQQLRSARPQRRDRAISLAYHKQCRQKTAGVP
jgi:hypothetical protein